MRRHLFTVVLAAVAASACAVRAQQPQVTVVAPHVGEMSAGIVGRAPAPTRQTLRFEPIQMLDDLFRTDIVLLMRHGPTDWSVRDPRGVAPTDCGQQRNLSVQGRADMVDLGVLLSGNGIRPGRIVVSEWCRAQDTMTALAAGFATIDADHAAGLAVETDPGINLLLSLRGAATVTPLRRLIETWTGDGESGPLLIISHYTNIEELTDFRVYEGEILVLDPRLDGRVIGYLRLRSAGPDVGHFPNHRPQDDG